MNHGKTLNNCLILILRFVRIPRRIRYSSEVLPRFPFHGFSQERFLHKSINYPHIKGVKPLQKSYANFEGIIFSRKNGCILFFFKRIPGYSMQIYFLVDMIFVYGIRTTKKNDPKIDPLEVEDDIYWR